MSNPKVINIKKERACDECNECCQGWLSGESHGHFFQRGQPCFFLQKTCTIYEDRPANPCVSYMCAWLDGDDFPMWMRPNMSGVIITKRKEGDIEFFDAVECGKKMDSSVLSYLILWALRKSKNFKYQIEGGVNYIGSNEFCQFMTTRI